MVDGIFVGIFGVCVGSFINVVIRRFIQDVPLTGRSHCERCHRILSWYDMIPLISFSMLRGRCRSCHHTFSVQYPIIELFIGCIFLILFLPLPSSYALLVSSTLTAVAICLLTILWVIDYYTYILPDIFIGYLGIVCLALIVVNKQPSVISSIAGVAIGSGFLGFLWAVTRGKGLGFGDVKLLIPLGALLGGIGTLVLLWLSFIVGGLVASMLLLRGKASFKTAIPFGPFLIGFAILFLLIPSLPGALFSLWIGWDILHV